MVLLKIQIDLQQKINEYSWRKNEFKFKPKMHSNLISAVDFFQKSIAPKH